VKPSARQTDAKLKPRVTEAESALKFAFEQKVKTRRESERERVVLAGKAALWERDEVRQTSCESRRCTPLVVF
jgi:hypothetical protein